MKDLTGGIRTEDSGDGHKFSDHVACDGAEQGIESTDPDPQSKVIFLPDRCKVQGMVKVETVLNDEQLMMSTQKFHPGELIHLDKTPVVFQGNI